MGQDSNSKSVDSICSVKWSKETKCNSTCSSSVTLGLFFLYFFTSLPWKENRVETPLMKALGKSKLSRKYQVTVPKNVRDLLKLNMGDLLVFVENQRHVLLKRGIISIES
jgi:AbrB family looped-hinge helix DNA binding protein